MKKKSSLNKEYTYYKDAKNIKKSSNIPLDLKEQLLQALQQAETQKLQKQLQIQKRSLVEQQYQNLLIQNKTIRQQLQQIKQQVNRMSRLKKKINKQKQQPCQQCKNYLLINQSFQREREILQKDRSLLKQQIEKLKKQIDQNKRFNCDNDERLIQNLKKQGQKSYTIITNQRELIDNLNERVGLIEIQNLQILRNVQLIEQNFQQLQMENIMLKGFKRKDTQSRRKTGSFKNFDKYSISGTQQCQSFIS